MKYSQNQYAYNASAVLCSKDTDEPVTFFAFEWVNPRLGMEIKDVTLKAVNHPGGSQNTIIMLGLSITENLKAEQATGNERQ